MNKFDIIEFLKAEVEPLPDRIYGNRYRASAYLIDGTYLPCVVFQSKGKQVDLALKRFEQEKNQPDQYRMVVEVFRGNVWTHRRIAWAIYEAFGVSYHENHIPRILDKIGWTRQKPKRRATQRNEAVIQEWKACSWQAISGSGRRCSTNDCVYR